MIGRQIKDLSPSPKNNRNSEGAFITLNDGKILFAYSRYGNEGCDDGAAADIYAMISEDNGDSFCEPFALLTHEDVKADNIMSVSFLRMENGDIGMFFLTKRDVDQCLCCLIRSSDEGKSWSEPVLCSKNKGYFVVNNDRIIRLKNGRILIPAAYHKIICKTDKEGKKYIHTLESGVFTVFASDDDGYTWETIAEDIIIPHSRGCTTGVQEPGLIQLEDGKIWCVIRNDSGKQYECFSEDNGDSWTQPVPSQFSSAVSPLSFKRLYDGKILAVWNPVPIYNGRATVFKGAWTGARTPLVAAISFDDGQKFTLPTVIENEDDHGYCYVAIHETDDKHVLLAYCAGGPRDGSTLNRLRIKKIHIDEI